MNSVQSDPNPSIKLKMDLLVLRSHPLFHLILRTKHCNITMLMSTVIEIKNLSNTQNSLPALDNWLKHTHHTESKACFKR